jgi:hypothetical protein
MTNRCENCQHWDRLSPPSDTGYCEAISEEHESPQQGRANLTDEGALHTHKDFFCGMFEETTKP